MTGITDDEAAARPETRMVISGCVHCQQILVRGRDRDCWRRIPARGEVLYPGAAIACPGRPDHLPHQSPMEVR